jgi:hypothetical protein
VGPREVWEVTGELEILGNLLRISPLGTVDGHVVVRGFGAGLTGLAGEITESVLVENADTVRLTNMIIGTDLILRNIHDANLIGVEIGGNLRTQGGTYVRGEAVRVDEDVEMEGTNEFAMTRLGVGRSLTATLSEDTTFQLRSVEIEEDLILLGEAPDQPCIIKLESLGGICDLSGLHLRGVDACSIDGCNIE